MHEAAESSAVTEVAGLGRSSPSLLTMLRIRCHPPVAATEGEGPTAGLHAVPKGVEHRELLRDSVGSHGAVLRPPIFLTTESNKAVVGDERSRLGKGLSRCRRAGRVVVGDIA